MSPGKNPKLLHLSLFWCWKKQDKICTVQTSNLTSDVRRLFTRCWRGFPQSIAQLLFYSVHVMIASCEVSIKHKTRVRQKAFVLSGDGRRRMLKQFRKCGASRIERGGVLLLVLFSIAERSWRRSGCCMARQTMKTK